MKYAYLKDGKVIDWNVTEEMIATRGHSLDIYTPVVETAKPEVSEDCYVVYETVPKLVKGKLTQQWATQTLPKDVVVPNLKARLAEIRFAKETAGITFKDQTIPTTREVRYQLIQSKHVEGTDTINWKLGDSWLSLTQEDLDALLIAIATYVEKCYSAERTVSEKISKVKAPEKLDVETLFNDAFAA